MRQKDLEPLSKMFYAFVSKKVLGKITDNMEKLKRAFGEIQAQVCPPNFFGQYFAL